MARGRLAREADRILNGGLRALLAEHGEVHVIGSYALDLMTWRDLDIHLVREACDRHAFFRLGGDIAALLGPHRMHFRDETIVRTPGLPAGLYWGIYLGDERGGAWKIDVWQTTREAFEPVRQFGEAIASRLTEENRRIIVSIKDACWRHPEYRRSFTSADIYSAVLDRGVRDLAGFRADLEQRKGIRDGFHEAP
jgi:hypothetical protein